MNILPQKKESDQREQQAKADAKASQPERDIAAELRAPLIAEREVQTATETLVRSIAAEIDRAAGDKEKLTKLSATLRESSRGLAAAVAANTGVHAVPEPSDN